MKNKNLVAWGMIASIALAIINGVTADNDGIYSLAGIGLFAFGVWASIILLNHKQ